jgi:hypothetical protein
MARISNVTHLRVKLKEFINENHAYVELSASNLSNIISKWTKVQRQKFHQQARYLNLSFNYIDSIESKVVLEAVMKNLKITKGVDVGIKIEPFIYSILQSRQLAIQMDLVKKARIVVPDSALLIGVIDENGILEEDEIFV